MLNEINKLSLSLSLSLTSFPPALPPSLSITHRTSLTQDTVASEDGILLIHQQCHVIFCMARGGHHFECSPPLSLQCLHPRGMSHGHQTDVFWMDHCWDF